jgi:hypothetical protein
MKRICYCKEFKENMPKLENATMFAFIHGCQLGPNFTYFKYCPWCGERMYFIDDVPINKSNETSVL